MYIEKTEMAIIKSEISQSPSQNFEKLVLEAVDEAFSFLGETCKTALYSRLEGIFEIRKEEIPVNIDKFTEAIEEIFGGSAQFLEILIMRALYRKIEPLGYFPGKVDLVFNEYLKVLRDYL